MTLCTLSLAAIDKICIIHCIPSVETINLDLHITIININSKIDIGHDLILHTAKGTQENNYKHIKYFGNHTPLPRIAEKQLQYIIEAMRETDNINSCNLQLE